MTLKRDKKRELARKQLMEKEQETTHSLVSKFSKEMINLIQEKELAVLVSLINLVFVSSIHSIKRTFQSQGLEAFHRTKAIY
jgi:hypothetical protein